MKGGYPKMIYQYDEVWGTKIMNTTPHTITFMHEDKTNDVIPCGKILNAHIMFTTDTMSGGIEIVKQQWLPTPDGLRFLQETSPDIIVIGSVIAAQAYPGMVKMLVPYYGYERAPHGLKRMRPDKFAIY